MTTTTAIALLPDAINTLRLFQTYFKPFHKTHRDTPSKQSTDGDGAQSSNYPSSTGSPQTGENNTQLTINTQMVKSVVVPFIITLYAIQRDTLSSMWKIGFLLGFLVHLILIAGVPFLIRTSTSNRSTYYAPQEHNSGGDGDVENLAPQKNKALTIRELSPDEDANFT